MIIIKNLVKNYVLNLTSEDVIKYRLKEGVEVTTSEAEIFVSTVKANVDYILDGHAKEVLESKKSSFSESVYFKLNELINKYSKFI